MSEVSSPYQVRRAWDILEKEQKCVCVCVYVLRKKGVQDPSLVVTSQKGVPDRPLPTPVVILSAVVLPLCCLNQQCQHHLLEMRVLRPHPRPTGSETLGVGPPTGTFTGPSGTADLAWSWRTTALTPSTVPASPPLVRTVPVGLNG